MSTTDDFYINNQPGAPFRAELNTILAALATANAGSTEPPNPQPGIMWLDTSRSPWVLKRRNSANTGWITQYDTSNKPSKADVGLSNVDNFSSTSSLTDGSDSKFARAKAAKALEDKKLDKTATAADSSKLGGKLANTYAQQTGSYPGLRAKATTKNDVGLSNVANYTASASVTLNSNTSYALSSALFSLNNSKLDKVEQAADSAKLGGKLPAAFALSVHSHSASDLPIGTTSARGILQLIDSVTSTSTSYAAATKSVKTAYDKGIQAYNLANSAKNIANNAYPKTGGNLNGAINFTPDTGDILKLDGKTLLHRHTQKGAVSFGADEGVVIGSGESRGLTAANVSTAWEVLHLSSDNEVVVRTNLQSGWSNRKEFYFQKDGGFKPANIQKTQQNLGLSEMLALKYGVESKGDIPRCENIFYTGGVGKANLNNCPAGLDPLLAHPDAPNSPPVGVYHYITTYIYGSDPRTANKTQVAIPYNGGSIWTRYRFSNNWSSWQELAPTTAFLKPKSGWFVSTDSVGRAHTLPAGGTWAYWMHGISSTRGDWYGNSNAGVAAGGTTITLSAGDATRGFAWRIS